MPSYILVLDDMLVTFSLYFSVIKIGCHVIFFKNKVGKLFLVDAQLHSGA